MEDCRAERASHILIEPGAAKRHEKLLGISDEYMGDYCHGELLMTLPSPEPSPGRAPSTMTA